MFKLYRALRSRTFGEESMLRSICVILPLVWSCSPKLIVASTLLATVESLLPISHIYLTKLFVDSIVSVINEGEGVTHTLSILSVQLLFVVLQLLCSKANTLVNVKLQQLTELNFERMVMRTVMIAPLVYYDTDQFHDKITRASNGIHFAAISAYLSVIEIAKLFITIISCLLFLLGFHWLLALVVFVLLVPNMIANVAIGEKQYQRFVHDTPYDRRSVYLSSTIKGKEAAKELRIFGHGEFLLGLWEKTQQYLHSTRLQLEKATLVSRFKLEIMGVSVEKIVAVVLLFYSSRGMLTVGSFMSVLQSLSTLQGGMKGITQGLGSLSMNTKIFKETYDFLRSIQEVTNKRNLNPKHLPTTILQGISIKDLSFSYPESTKTVLKGITFDIKVGEKVAIVGGNGAGKSTLIKCISGLYEGQSGKIEIDGIDIRVVNQSELHNKFTVVFQDFVSYNLTVKENIIVSDLKQQTSGWLNEVLDRTGFSSFIDKLPDRLDTVVGSGFFGGEDLSKGQWQRIALSRGIFRDREIIIFDEPTASIDPVTESNLMKDFLEITAGKTSILVTHRLASCKYVDKIIVLNEGEVAEIGSHTELMAEKGHYYQMYNEQSKWYKDEMIQFA